jgi:hypothetical protein
MEITTVPIAEEFIQEYWDVSETFMERVRDQMSRMSGVDFNNIPDLMVAFAKAHVKAALEAAAAHAVVGGGGTFHNGEHLESAPTFVVKSSILNAYPTDNIK